ncbi:hypothetical protein [Streptomyces sp. MK5]|uniref:hypothetical protein n=1 Tax=Streptomyces sp. MK5 TaxID=3064253 RepID=UPI0027417129|nr:hypothetical protein [Streptomyces sp. MK5]
MGTTYPLDPEANNGNTLVNPLNPDAGSGLVSTFPAASDAGAGSTLINPLDPNAGTGWSSLFPVDPSAGLPSVVLAVPGIFPIYRAPKAKDAEYERLHGPNPANHQPGMDIGGGLLSDGLIYFGERSVAAEYMSPTGRNFADGMVRYDMHPDFLKEFAKSPYMGRYDLKGPNGTPRIEFTIPVDKLERFNELTLGKTWIAINGSG